MEQKAQNTYFHRLDPRVKMALLFIFTIYIFTTRNFIVISLMFAAVVLMWVTSKIPLSRIAGMIKFMIPVILFIIVVQALFQLGETDLVNPIIPKSRAYYRRNRADYQRRPYHGACGKLSALSPLFF